MSKLHGLDALTVLFGTDDDFDVTASANSEMNIAAAAIATIRATVPLITQTLYLTEPGEAGAINVADINQGQIGDCFLLSPIGEIAMQKPSFISNMIHLNANGTESVTLYRASNGSLPSWNTTSFKAVAETVTNVFPNYSVNNGATQDVVGSQKEIWPQVLEDAVATLNGGYAAIAGGGSPVIAMEELTGHAAGYMAPASLTLALLQSFVAAGDLIVMDTLARGALPNNLVNSHAYMFDGITGTGAAATVHLLNPWGFDQPTAMLVSQLSHGFAEVDIGRLS
jgi:hypothetical protein